MPVVTHPRQAMGVDDRSQIYKPSGKDSPAGTMESNNSTEIRSKIELALWILGSLVAAAYAYLI